MGVHTYLPPSTGNISAIDAISMILSALLWRKNMGKIALFTNHFAVEQFNRLGICALWDAGINETALNDYPKDINLRTYWASAKILALTQLCCPVTILDYDIFIWKDISHILRSGDITVFHFEELIDCYKNMDELHIRDGYVFNETWDWSVNPYNTAILHFNNDTFKEYYAECSIDFMRGNMADCPDGVSQMVFAEQRLLSMCAHEKHIQVNTILEGPYCDNELCTHLWGAKSAAKQSEVVNQILQGSILKKIRQLSLDYYQIATQCIKALS